MNKFCFVLLLTGVTTFTNAQITNLGTNADSLVAILKKTPSYRDQIKDDKQKEFETIYNALKNDTAATGNVFDNFYKLAKLFFPIRDNHLGFYLLPTTILPKEYYKNATMLKQYKLSAFFKDYPWVSLNLDSLQSVLRKKSKDSVEGIYYYDNFLTIGLYRTATTNELTGVVLKTTIPVWQKGEIAIKLYEYMPNYFRAIYGHPVSKALILYNNEKFRNQSLINSSFYSSLTESPYRKNVSVKDYSLIPRSEDDFIFKNINDSIQYIRLGNFSAMDNDMEISQRFYDRIKDSLIGHNLIVDLRDNTGGADKVSDKFRRLIKEYTRKGNVYLLVNNGTMSQGEIFTLSLKGSANIKVYGQTTKGTIAYGSNYGKTIMLPGKQYQVYLTDMRGGPYSRYESYGVEPEKVLENNADWIKQVIAEIGK